MVSRAAPAMPAAKHSQTCLIMVLDPICMRKHCNARLIDYRYGLGSSLEWVSRVPRHMLIFENGYLAPVLIALDFEYSKMFFIFVSKTEFD